MNDLQQQLEDLQQRLLRAWGIVDIGKKQERMEALEQEMSKPGFWNNQDKARHISEEASGLRDEIDLWQKFKQDLEDLMEMLKLDIEDQGVNMREDFEKQIAQVEKRFAHMEVSLLLARKYDKKSALVSLYAGTGGTDAQDWVEMLLRMYLRFAEKQGWKTEITNISSGQEAGIKSVQFEVEGRYAYGYLKAESGVHRLVRISPFDAEKMRHTSFAMVEVLPWLDDEVTVEINPDELRIDTFRAGGHGGQSVNTTDSAVRITHIPTGIVVSCQNERSQIQNKEKAFRHLQSKLQQYYEAEAEEEKQKLRGEYTEAAWGNQARSYVLHPYKMVKDHRTGEETDKVDVVLDGEIMPFVEAYLRTEAKK